MHNLYQKLSNVGFETPLPLEEVTLKLLDFYDGLLTPADFGEDIEGYRLNPTKDLSGYNIYLRQVEEKTEVVFFALPSRSPSIADLQTESDSFRNYL